MDAYSPQAWDSFFLANAGASAALAGLLFVGVSINVETIVRSGLLVDRALDGFTLLTAVLLVSMLVLVPGITDDGLGIGVAVLGLVSWLVVVALDRRVVPALGGERNPDAPRASTAVRLVLGQAATLPMLIAAATLVVGSGGGLYWLVPAVAFSYLSALSNAWILLIEIRR